jgi:hypothetical protein
MRLMGVKIPVNKRAWVFLIALTLLVFAPLHVNAAEGYYREVFVDGGCNLSSMRYYPAAESKGLTIEYMATDSESVSRNKIAGDANDSNGALLYPDGEPRFKYVYTNGGRATNHGNCLGSTGRANMRTFFNNGGSYGGSCGGFFITATKLRGTTWSAYYHIWPGNALSTGVSGICHKVYLPKGSDLLKYEDFGSDDSYRTCHYGGPYATSYPSGTKLQGELTVSLGRAQAGDANVISHKDNGRSGRIVISGSHPEYATIGEEFKVQRAMLQYALDGAGDPSVKATLSKDTWRTMNNNSKKDYEKLGDKQYHHFIIDIPSGTKSLTIDVDGREGYDFDVFAKSEDFAFRGRSGVHSAVSSGADEHLVVQNPSPGHWYIGVKLVTDVGTTRHGSPGTASSKTGTYWKEYSSRVEVLNGIPYAIKADYSTSDGTSPVAFSDPSEPLDPPATPSDVISTPMLSGYELLWHSTLEDHNAVTNPIKGSPGEPSGVTYSTSDGISGAHINNTDSIRIPIRGNVDNNAGAIEFWYKRVETAVTWGRFFDTTSHAFDGFALHRRYGDQRASMDINNKLSGDSNFLVNINPWNGDWHFIRYFYDTAEDEYRLYIDNVLQGTITYDFDSFDASYDFIIGNYRSGLAPGNGIFADFKIYKKGVSNDSGEPLTPPADPVVPPVVDPAPDISACTHYLAVDGSNSNSGTLTSSPWRSFAPSLEKLGPGDTLCVREGTYQIGDVDLARANSGTSDNWITVTSYGDELVRLRGPGDIDMDAANYWIFDNLTFERFTSTLFKLGSHSQLSGNSDILSHHIAFRNCTFRHGAKPAISFHNADEVSIVGNTFKNIRPRAAFYTVAAVDSEDRVSSGVGEFTMVAVKYRGKNILIQDNLFEDAGSDGIQLGAQSYKSGSDIRAIQVIGNTFRVTRDSNGRSVYKNIYGNRVTRYCNDNGLDDIDSEGYCDFARNTSENGLDVKKVAHRCCSFSDPHCSSDEELWYENCRIVVSGNTFSGFRPTSPSQDCSGDIGNALAFRYDARNALIEKNFFYDNTMNLSITTSRDTEGSTRNFIVRNNIFEPTVEFEGYSYRFNGRTYSDFNEKTGRTAASMQIHWTRNVRILNNTFLTDDSYFLYSYGSDSSVLRNNIVSMAEVSITGPQDWTTDHNLWIGDTSLDSDLADRNSIHTSLSDARIDMSTYMPREGSPAIDAGVLLSDIDSGVPDDYSGYRRPGGTGYDIGAMETAVSAPLLLPVPSSGTAGDPVVSPRSLVPDGVPTGYTLVWKSTLDNSDSVTSPETGVGGSVHGVQFVDVGSYRGARVNQGQMIRIPIETNLSNPQRGIVEFWYKQDDSPIQWGRFFDTSLPDPYDGFTLQRGESDSICLVDVQNEGDTTFRLSDVNPWDGNWHFVRYMYDLTEETPEATDRVRLYIDNIDQGEIFRDYPGILVEDNELIIGNAVTGLRPANGVFDDFAIYSYVATGIPF